MPQARIVPRLSTGSLADLHRQIAEASAQARPACQGAGRGRLQLPVRGALSCCNCSLSPESLEGFSGVTFARHFCTKKAVLDQRAGFCAEFLTSAPLETR